MKKNILSRDLIKATPAYRMQQNKEETDCGVVRESRTTTMWKTRLKRAMQLGKKQKGTSYIYA